MPATSIGELISRRLRVAFRRVRASVPSDMSFLAMQMSVAKQWDVDLLHVPKPALRKSWNLMH
jgi:hypothetical protein